MQFSKFSIMTKKYLCALMTITLLAACAPNGPVSKRDAGTILGAAGGTVLGASIGKGKGNIIAIALGALAGAAVGGSIGNSMDELDMIQAGKAMQRGLNSVPNGQTVDWYNGESGNSGYVTPTNSYRADNGRYCREYNSSVIIGGKVHEAYGTACRKPDGSWEIIK